MNAPNVLFFGGNGHAAWRLERVRAVLEGRPGAPALVDVPYPGFEGRPRAPSLDDFLTALNTFCRGADPGSTVMATGIGALIALSLRASDALPFPLILQGPVLWGLEQRHFPRLMRWSPARPLLESALRQSWFQKRFVRKQFRKPLASAERAHFFDGYARCTALGDFFTWFTPDWLRELEARFASRPEALGGITVWAGGRDGVVGPGDVRATERALGVRWPVVAFPEWGHYPMIDVPEEWADALCHALAAA